LAIYRELNCDPYGTKINKCIKISLSFHRGLFGLKLSPHPQSLWTFQHRLSKEYFEITLCLAISY